MTIIDKNAGPARRFLPWLLLGLMISAPLQAQMDAREAIDHLMRGFERIEPVATLDGPIGTQGSYLVQRGDTLDAIIAKTLGNVPIRRSLLRQAFVKANPSAFRRGDPNYVFAGKTLKVPDVEDLSGVVFTDSAAMSRHDDKSHWIRYPY